jgi:hypothetical protein
VFIQQAMHMELPENMRQMRQVLCSAWSLPTEGYFIGYF